MAYWLVKSEPGVYNIDNLKQDKQTAWDGVRNYQARNNLKAMKKGDQVLFYHSANEIIGVAGLAKVLKEAFPDPLQFDKKSKYFDLASNPENPRWFCSQLGFVKKFKSIITLAELKKHRQLKEMALLQRGSRLSVQPVSEKEFEFILSLVQEMDN